MKSILERALVHLLNEENEKAEELLHQFVIETARGIHETLREGDEELEADLDADMEGDEFFGEDDLDDEADVKAAEDLSDDLGEEVPAEAEAEDLTDDALEVEGEEGNIESEIEDFEQELADLQAKFDAMLSQIEGEEEEVMDAVDDMEDMGDDMEDMGDDLSDEDFVKEDDDEDDFDDITESVIDELQKVSAIEAEGKGANGEDLLGNKTSLKFNKPAASATRSQSTNRVGHTGYARETAPSSTALKGGKTVASTAMRNVRKDADAGNHKTTATSEGPKAALRTKPKDANAKSPISGKPLGKK